MAWNLNDDSPIYLQLKKEIEVRIISGKYPCGSQLPGVRILAQEASVNPNTMQKALQELEREELVYAQRTSGRFVTEDQNKIKELRAVLAEEQVEKFIYGMNKLGIPKEEIMKLIAQIIKED